MNEIISALKSLLNFDKPMDQIDQELNRLRPSMPDEHLVILTRQQVISVLQRYMQGLFNQEDLQSWFGKLMRGCDQIGYEKGYGGIIDEVLTDIDCYTEPGDTLSLQKAQALINRLSSTPFDPTDD